MITILIIIAVIIAVTIIAALIIGTQMNLEMNVIINKPIKLVFEYLRLMKNQDNFSVWNKADPEMKKDYKGIDGTVGFVYSWDSTNNKNVGSGEQEITLIDEEKRIEYEVRFIRPMQNVAKTAFVFNSINDNQTKVQWGFYGKMKFPMNIIKPVFVKLIRNDLETGLQNLKNILENK
jgi:hypothetical protein